MIQRLKRARAALDGAWSGPAAESSAWDCRGTGPWARVNPLYGPEARTEPMWLRGDNGGPCFWDSEGLTHFSVAGALRSVGDDGTGWDALEAVLASDLRAWLWDPNRKVDHVLDLFSRAIKRAGRDS